MPDTKQCIIVDQYGYRAITIERGIAGGCCQIKAQDIVLFTAIQTTKKEYEWFSDALAVLRDNYPEVYTA